MALGIGGIILVASLLQSLPSIVRIYTELETQAEKLAFFNNNNNKDYPPVYDFIIVGGGSAGAVLANRLSEKYNTLLIERGLEPNPMQSIPVIAAALLNNPDVDYRYHTVPQRSSCLSLNNKQSLWSRGKHLGGSSNLNIQIYLRGHPKDYENWVNITGDTRWSYDNVLKYFKKSENYCIKCEPATPDGTFNPKYHHMGGYLSVSKTQHALTLTDNFLKASEWNGLKRKDLNGHYEEGCAPLLLTQKNGRRSSTGIAFLDPIRLRKTLTIQKVSQAYKILLKNEDGSTKAYGIEYEKFGVKQVAYALKEVIISAGAIDSPKILMLSGIGPKLHLQKLGIPVTADLPVGRNLHDHLSTIVGPFLINETSSMVLERDIGLDNVTEYINQGTGILASSMAAATSVFTSKYAKKAGEDKWPDLQHIFIASGVSKFLPETYASGYNVDLNMAKDFFGPVEGKDAFFILTVLSRPKSRGELLLRSADYRDDPVINPKYLEDRDKHDIKVLLDGVKTAEKISEKSPAFAKMGTHLSNTPWPACTHHKFKSDGYWTCYIRHLSLTVWHYVGTASMGRRDSPKSVVDEEMRVIGVKNLRVIDASIMPDIVSINTNAPTIMLAERGSQLILDMYK